MISLLRDLIMIDETPSGDKAVYVFIEMFALGFVLYAIEEAFKDGVSWLKVAIAFALGLVFFLLGVNWIKLKSNLHSAWVVRLDRITNDYRYRYGAVVLLFGVVGFYVLASLHALRPDLDTYLIPRRVTPLQSVQLRQYLSMSHPGISVDVIVNSSDQEATEYAAQLMNAISGIGEWDARLVTVSPFNPDRPELVAKDGYHNVYSAMDSGLVVRECAPAIGGYDPKHPPSSTLLYQALDKAQIEIHSSGSQSGCTGYSVSLEVGHRPMKIGQQEPILGKLGRWLQQMAYQQ